MTGLKQHKKRHKQLKIEIKEAKCHLKGLKKQLQGLREEQQHHVVDKLDEHMVQRSSLTRCLLHLFRK